VSAPPRVAALGRPLIWVAEVTSTNDLARLLAAAGAPEGAVVVSDVQTHGRGRLGRVWYSPPGGLWCSILLRPTHAHGLGRLSLGVAVAVAEAVEAETDVHVGIRWPNDLVAGGRKLCGVLIEAAAGSAVVVGIGVNVCVDVQALPAEIAARATSLHLLVDPPPDRRRLLDAVLARVGHWYASWLAESREVLDAWAARDVTRGTRLTIGASAGVAPVEGTAVGVDDDGALLVRRDDGGTARVLAGDLHPAAPL
jgi:BirA family biotin operon repressor/biotin-[acetyl-CoA-carboxylase] ligase